MTEVIGGAFRPGVAVTHRGVSSVRGKALIGLAIGVISAVNFLSAMPAASATLTALSCSFGDVNASVSAASNGDTVTVPSGNCSWSSGLTISKAITVAGAGIGRTVITNNYTGGSLITVNESTLGSAKVSGFDFVPGAGPVNANPDFFIKVTASSGGRPVLITGNKFSVSSNRNALGFQTNRGVIWNNTFVGTLSGNYMNNASCLRHKGTGLDTSWNTRATWGASDSAGDRHLYFETNTIRNVLECVDVDDNARTVLRHNDVTNSNFGTHGTDTSHFGGRYYEVYRNTFTYDQTLHPGPAGNQPANVMSFTSSRGGSGVIWENNYGDIRSQAWGNKAEIQFAAENARRNAGPYACWRGGYPIPHQVGWGFTSGSTRVADVYQDPEPIYIWSNSGTGNTPTLIEYADQCGGGASVSYFIQAGRDYHVGVAKPGYTPYVYPHPLAGGTGGAPNLAAPSNLQIR